MLKTLAWRKALMRWSGEECIAGLPVVQACPGPAGAPEYRTLTALVLQQQNSMDAAQNKWCHRLVALTPIWP